MPQSWTGKNGTILIGNQLGVDSCLKLNKPKGKESWKKKIRNLFCLKQVLPQAKAIIYKATKKSFGPQTVLSPKLREYWTGNGAI